jgi:hypothetical protein
VGIYCFKCYSSTAAFYCGRKLAQAISNNGSRWNVDADDVDAIPNICVSVQSEGNEGNKMTYRNILEWWLRTGNDDRQGCWINGEATKNKINREANVGMCCATSNEYFRSFVLFSFYILFFWFYDVQQHNHGVYGKLKHIRNMLLMMTNKINNDRLKAFFIEVSSSLHCYCFIIFHHDDYACVIFPFQFFVYSMHRNERNMFIISLLIHTNVKSHSHKFNSFTFDAT